ncbi:hypothetical protein AGMMS50212_04660 [Spirochaetia bacterium]|nr:hypothetical protein AGMMS50212_04660 [Spirochaetia bacterium]
MKNLFLLVILMLCASSLQSFELYIGAELGFGKSLWVGSEYDDFLSLNDNVDTKLSRGFITHFGFFTEGSHQGLFAVFGAGRGPHIVYLGIQYDFYFLEDYTEDFKLGISAGLGIGFGLSKIVDNTVPFGLSPYLQLGVPIYCVKKIVMVQPFVSYYLGTGVDFTSDDKGNIKGFSNDFGYDWRAGITLGFDIIKYIKALRH